MLVLSRKEGERLVIGDNVTITVNRISGNRITLGIDAPKEVRIVRGELGPKEGDQQASERPTSRKQSHQALGPLEPGLEFEIELPSANGSWGS